MHFYEECRIEMATHHSYLDASQVLAAALEQMDDIIAGTQKEFQNDILNGHTSNGGACTCNHGNTVSVAVLLERLKLAIDDANKDKNCNKSLGQNVNPQTANFLCQWLQRAQDQEIDQGNGQNHNYEEVQQKIYHLESEREHLLLQVNVLTEQVDAQNEKITELEASLTENKEQLNSSEAMLRQEMTSRSSFETSKLDLMAQVSALRLRLATAEQERQEFEEKSSKLESELVLTYACLAEKEADLATLKSKLSRNGTINTVTDNNSEIQKLKGALSSVIAANDEKEKKIQELKSSLNRYKKLQELVFSGHGWRASDGPNSVGFNKALMDDSGNLSVTEIDLKTELPTDGRLAEKPPPVPRQHQHPLATSSPTHEDRHDSSLTEAETSICSPMPSPINSSLTVPFTSTLTQRANSSDNVSPPSQPKTPPALRHYGTIPRQHGPEILQQIHQQLQQHKLDQSSKHSSIDRSGESSPNKSSQSFHNLHHPGLDNFRPVRTKTSGVSFGKGFFRLRSGKRSSSAPELALPEDDQPIVLPETPRSTLPSSRQTASPLTVLEAKEKSKGIKKIFGKIKRTGSENLDSNQAEFRRGGIRATAGPRLGWTNDAKTFNNGNLPFSKWDGIMVAEWLSSIGLGMYSAECKKCLKTGDQLLKASTQEFEKVLGVKNPLHKKKLQLAVSSPKGNTGDKMDPFQKLDFQWIIRWLDDIGLPQYKDAFFDARVDGCVLHQLTVEDLFHLKVTNQLHHISIKRGIQVLRENDFNPQCLKRRSLPEDEQTPLEVTKWTNHRVMEWLRTVDLSEYAPNLRGSGVHGALMVYEPRFNADLLATMLNIPPNKTLLRRHLCTQFKQLVGADLMQKKREWEAQPSYSPLSPSAKIKAVRRGQFTLMRKRNKVDVELEDYVCPIDFLDKSFGSVSPLLKTGGKNELQKKQDIERFLKKEDGTLSTHKTDKSTNIKSIATLLQDESMEATNV